MRTGVTVSVTAADLDRLRSLIGDRNAAQKHVWRARIVLLSAEGLGTNAIMSQTGKSKTCVWHWQERFAAEGFEGLLRDKTRPSRIPKLDTAIDRFLDDHNAHSKPFQWVADPNKIIATVIRGHQVLDHSG